MFKRVRNFLLHNWSLKILSLAFAFVMWIFVTMKAPHEEMPAEVKIIYKNPPKNAVLMSEAPQSLLIRVSGPWLALKSLKKRALYYEIDLKGIRSGTSTFTIIPSKIDGLPPNTQVTSVNPSYFTLTYDRKITRTLKVKLITISEPKKGYRIKNIQVTPKRVEVSGPEKILKTMEEIQTEPVDITDASFTIERDVTLDQSIKGLEFLTQDTVKVLIEIEPIWVSKDFKDIPITVLNTPYKYRVKPDKLDIKLTLMEAALEELTPDKIQLYIDADGLKPGEYTTKPMVKLPEEMLLQKQPPLPEVKLKLWVEASPESKIPLGESNKELKQ